MKKNIFFIVAFFTLFGCTVTETIYAFPIDANTIDHIAFYSRCCNEKSRKVNLNEDGEIDAAVSALSQMTIYDEYEHYPAGGQIFWIIFYLSDGTEYAYTYLDSGDKNIGYFTDGAVRIKVAGCGLTDLWNTVSEKARLDEPDIGKISIL